MGSAGNDWVSLISEEDGLLNSYIHTSSSVFANGETFQYTVKANTWFGSRVSGNGNFSLVGCTVYPGFDFNDFELANRKGLIQLFPQHQSLISELTRL